MSMMEVPDYYELLQISPAAEPDTIHRVYRFLAARFHPDNTETGDPEKFALLQQAYDVLSNPERRAVYNARRQRVQPVPLSTWVDFMDNLEGELNRRLAVLAVLYFQRRSNPYRPQLSFRDLERRIGFPRDYLEFTAWYLQSKKYITRADNAEFALTAEGVDFVEMQRASIPLLDKLLTSGDGFSTTDGAEMNELESTSGASEEDTLPARSRDS
jgi:curved DNA-binding protein CbpA